jgi:hypothetical protein
MTQENFEVEEENEFDLVLKQRTQEKQQDKKPAYTSNNDRDQIPWYGLENGQESVIRILGSTAEKRKENWHAKFIFYSEVLTDTRKRYSDIIWKTQKDPNDQDVQLLDDDWILKRLYESVHTKYWENKPFIDDKGNSKKGKYIYSYADTEIYKLINSNELDISNSKVFPKKFKPSKRVLLPILVRNEGSTQIKILTTKYSTKDYVDNQGNSRVQVYCDFGIPVSEYADKKYLYDLILEKIGYNYKHWDMDIVIKKNKLTDIQIAYDINPCYSDAVTSLAKSYVTYFPEMKPVQVVVNNKVVNEARPSKVPLTSEEESLPKINLDEMFQVTSYKKLFTYHKGLFQLADKELRTNFYEELVDLFVKENPEEAHLVSAQKITVPVTESIKSAPIDVTPVINKSSDDLPKPNARRSSSALPVGDTKEQQCQKVFKSWGRLTDAEKGLMINSIDSFVDGVPKFSKDHIQSILVCECDRKFLKSDGTESDINVSCHSDIRNCPMCEKTLSA